MLVERLNEKVVEKPKVARGERKSVLCESRNEKGKPKRVSLATRNPS